MEEDNALINNWPLSHDLVDPTCTILNVFYVLTKMYFHLLYYSALYTSGIVYTSMNEIKLSALPWPIAITFKRHFKVHFISDIC